MKSPLGPGRPDAHRVDAFMQTWPHPLLPVAASGVSARKRAGFEVEGTTLRGVQIEAAAGRHAASTAGRRRALRDLERRGFLLEYRLSDDLSTTRVVAIARESEGRPDAWLTDILDSRCPPYQGRGCLQRNPSSRPRWLASPRGQALDQETLAAGARPVGHPCARPSFGWKARVSSSFGRIARSGSCLSPREFRGLCITRVGLRTCSRKVGCQRFRLKMAQPPRQVLPRPPEAWRARPSQFSAHREVPVSPYMSSANHVLTDLLDQLLDEDRSGIGRSVFAARSLSALPERLQVTGS